MFSLWILSIWVLSRSTKNSHVKTNMVHTLHRIKATGMQLLESFKEMLIEEEYRKCLTNTMRTKTWYQLTAEVFVSFLFWVSHMHLKLISISYCSLTKKYIWFFDFGFNIYSLNLTNKISLRPPMRQLESTLRRLIKKIEVMLISLQSWERLQKLRLRHSGVSFQSTQLSPIQSLVISFLKRYSFLSAVGAHCCIFYSNTRPPANFDRFHIWYSDYEALELELEAGDDP